MRPLFRCADNDFSSKLTAIQAEGSSFQATLRRIQPLSAIYFTDDFMRTRSSGLWRPSSGNWQIYALQIEERSANPFSLFARFARSLKYNPLFTGRTRRYTGIGIRTERKPGSKGVPEEHIIYVFENTPAWRAGLRFGDVITAVDGIPVSRLGEDELVRRVAGPAGTSVRLSVRRVIDGAERNLDFTVQRETIDLDAIEETVPLAPGPLAEATFITTGYPFWCDYTFSVSAKPLGEGEFGQVFYRRDEANYHLFKWSADGALSLVKVAQNRPVVLAQRKVGGFRPGQYYRMEVSILGTRIAARVDDVAMLAAEDADLLWGEAGLYAAHSLGVYFDDVEIKSSDRPVETQAKGLGPLFTQDEYMKEWASTETDWLEPEAPLDHTVLPGVLMRWHKFSFPGPSRIEVRRFFADRLVLALNATGAGPEGQPGMGGGYLLDLDRSRGVGRLYRQSVRIGQTEPLPKFFSSVVFGLTGESERARGRLVAMVDRRPVLVVEEPAPLPGDRIGVGGDVGSLDLSGVVVASPNVQDETFTCAPVNWEVAGGAWGVMNRWVCDPRWSWFGGRSKSLAVIWSKASFAGDVTVDVFAAMEMPSYWKSPHEKASDIGLTLCGDGQNIASGYTLIFGGANNTWTRLYRQEHVVAETRSPLFLFAQRNRGEEEGLQLHRDWVHLTLKKQGNRVQFFLGRRLGLEFVDPQPLTGGRVAIWTVQNGLLIARARVACAGRQGAGLVIQDCREFTDANLSNQSDSASEEISSSITLGADAESYRVTNVRSGGNFAVFFRPRRIDLAATPVVSFDYRMPPTVKLDLYFDYDGDRHRVRLTGPGHGKDLSGSQSLAITVGEFSDVRPDNQWRHAEFRLYDALKDVYPYKSAFVISNVGLANYSNEGYLLAGIGGNHKGDSYEIRNMRFHRPQSRAAEVFVRSVEFPFQAASNTSRVIWRLECAQGGAVNFDRLTATVNERTFSVGHPALLLKRLEKVVELDLPSAGFQLRDGDTLRVSLRDGDRLLGGTSTAEWRFCLADDCAPPERIQITFARKDLAHMDFERDLGSCYPVGADIHTIPGPSGGWLRRELREDGSGHCLRVQNKRMAHDFGVGFMPTPWDLGRYPILSFDYRLPPGVSLDISFLLLDDVKAKRGRRVALRWATQSFRQDLRAYSTFPTAGFLTKPIQDNRWHHADINLFKKVKEFDPMRKEYFISDLHIADDVCGYLGNDEGVSFWLDNIRVRPVLNRDDLKPSWVASDVSGISDFQCGIDADPNARPAGKACGADVAVLKDGPTYFHLTVRDGAGNWSAPAHELAYLDVTPPEVMYFASAEDLPGTLDIRFVELGGLDPQSIVLRVGSRQYRVDNQRMWYDQRTQRLTWRAGKDWPAILQEARPCEPDAPDKRVIPVTLVEAKDYAGNAARTPQSWSWIVRPSVPGMLELDLPPLPAPPIVLPK